MAKFDVTVAPGATYEVEAPDENTAWKWAKAEHIRSLGKEGATLSEPPKFTPSGERGLPSSMSDYAAHPDLLAADPSMRFAMGAASPFLGLMQMIDNAAGGNTMNEHLKQLEDMKRSGREKIGSTGFDWTEGAGTVMSPAWRALPSSAPGASLLSKTGTGALQGAAAGVTAPVTNGGENFWADKGTQLGIGTMIGAATPATVAAASKVGKMAYHGFVEPAFEAGQRAIKGRAYLEAAGNKADEIADLLAQNKQIVPGSMPTAGEAASPAGRAEFSALQQSAEKVRPSEYLERSDSQNQARVAAVNEFAGTPAKMAEATAAREAAAKPHYELGEQQKLPFDVVTFGALNQRPSTQSAVSRAQRLIQEKTGQKVDIPEMVAGQTVSGSEAQKIKLAFDDLIKLFPKSGMDSAELAAIRDTRNSYVEWMEQNFPALREARRTYKEMSAPVNQMEVGRALEDKLTPALREDAKLRSGAFASAVRDSASTIKKATGEPRFKELEDILTGRQLQSVHGVQQDLARSDRNLEMARRGAGAGPNALELATGNLEREAGGKMPNMLNRGVMLANAIIARLEGKVNRKMASEMAIEMLDPPKVGEALGAAKARELRNKLLAEQIARAHGPTIAATAATAAHQGE